MDTRITPFVMPISSRFSPECVMESPLIESAGTVSSCLARYAICESRAFAGFLGQRLASSVLSHVLRSGSTWSSEASRGIIC
jgi:hypothetical protein